MPECRINLSQAAAYLARAPKSNDRTSRSPRPCATCASAATCGRRRTFATPRTRARSGSGHGAGYVYPHDRPEEAAKQQYLPDELAGTRYYPEDAPGA